MKRDERLARLRAAERRANWRERDLRYGNQYRRPYGTYEPSRQKQSALENVLVISGILILGLLIASM